MASQKQGKTIYLPPIYDPKKIREGIREILNLVEAMEQKDDTKDCMKGRESNEQATGEHDPS